MGAMTAALEIGDLVKRYPTGTEALKGVSLQIGAGEFFGLLDELYLHIAPVLLGAGERLLENVGDPELEPVEVVASPAVTHINYRVG